MASTTLLDADHVVTRNGVHCSKSDCVLPACVNRKLDKIINNGLKTEAKKINKELKKTAVVTIMEDSATATEENTKPLWEQDMEDLQSILEKHTSENDTPNEGGFTYQEKASIVDKITSSYLPFPVSQQQNVGQGMQLDSKNSEPFHFWMEEGLDVHECAMNSPKAQSSHPCFSVDQPIAAQETYSSKFSTAVPYTHDSQGTRNPLDQQPFSIPSNPNVQYEAEHRIHPGIGTRSAEAVILLDSKYPKEAKRDTLNSNQTFPIAEQLGNVSGVNRDPHRRFQSTRMLFRIFSLIFQALDSPRTAELEECYICALHKALTEIQAAKGRLLA